MHGKPDNHGQGIHTPVVKVTSIKIYLIPILVLVQISQIHCVRCFVKVLELYQVPPRNIRSAPSSKELSNANILSCSGGFDNIALITSVLNWPVCCLNWSTFSGTGGETAPTTALSNCDVSFGKSPQPATCTSSRGKYRLNAGCYCYHYGRS